MGVIQGGPWNVEVIHVGPHNVEVTVGVRIKIPAEGPFVVQVGLVEATAGVQIKFRTG